MVLVCWWLMALMCWWCVLVLCRRLFIVLMPMCTRDDCIDVLISWHVNDMFIWCIDCWCVDDIVWCWWQCVDGLCVDVLMCLCLRRSAAHIFVKLTKVYSTWFFSRWRSSWNRLDCCGRFVPWSSWDMFVDLSVSSDYCDLNSFYCLCLLFCCSWDHILCVCIRSAKSILVCLALGILKRIAPICGLLWGLFFFTDCRQDPFVGHLTYRLWLSHLCSYNFGCSLRWFIYELVTRTTSPHRPTDANVVERKTKTVWNASHLSLVLL